MLTVYAYSKCTTCRNALRWLDAHGVKYENVDIVSSPPSLATLSNVLEQSGLPIAKLFNTSGQSYREGNYRERLKTLTDEQALAELARDGKLIKRPLLVGKRVCLVGFDAERYETELARLKSG
jgi:arsenate reductase